MSLYSHRHVKIRLTRKERLWSCVILLESLLRCWALLCGVQHRENCLPAPASFFSRPTCPCCSENCCTALGPPSRPHPSTWLSTNTFCSTQVSLHLLTLLSCSWKCMEMERGPVQKGEQRRACSSFLFLEPLSFLFACERKFYYCGYI